MSIRLALMGNVAILLVVPAMAQNTNVEGRVVKLEKEMKAVQRQVFPNGAGKFLEPDIATPDTSTKTTQSSSAVADLLTRVDTLETQLASLTGQVEQHGNEMRSFETRLKGLETQLAKASAVNAASGNEPAAPASKPPATTTTPSTSKPKPPASTTAKPSAARTAAVAAIEKPSTGDAFEDSYNYGYRLWEAKFYPEAQAQLQETITKFPKHNRTSFARNLLGRAWLDDKKPASAVKIFYDNYKLDPRGERAPESLYFLGSALIDLNKIAEACEAFSELSKSYPEDVKTRLAGRLSEGRTRAKCK